MSLRIRRTIHISCAPSRAALCLPGLPYEYSVLLQGGAAHIYLNSVDERVGVGAPEDKAAGVAPCPCLERNDGVISAVESKEPVTRFDSSSVLILQLKGGRKCTVATDFDGPGYCTARDAYCQVHVPQSAYRVDIQSASGDTNGSRGSVWK